MERKQDTLKELEYRLYVQREAEFYHEPYHNDQNIYKLIKDGDIDEILKNQSKYANTVDDRKGKLSDDPVKNQIYHLIINAALIARICYCAGLPQETAYTLSDIYIRQADKCETVKDVKKTNDDMVLDFARQMKYLRKNKVLSPKIRQAVNYICDNLHKKITVAQLAKITGLNKSYLCSLFKKELSITIQKYILTRRIETAQRMLFETDYKEADISYTLGFSTQSYFCKCFKEQTGFTPHEYKRLHMAEYE